MSKAAMRARLSLKKAESALMFLLTGLGPKKRTRRRSGMWHRLPLLPMNPEVFASPVSKEQVAHVSLLHLPRARSPSPPFPDRRFAYCVQHSGLGRSESCAISVPTLRPADLLRVLAPCNYPPSFREAVAAVQPPTRTMDGHPVVLGHSSGEGRVVVPLPRCSHPRDCIRRSEGRFSGVQARVFRSLAPERSATASLSG
jgi:hypothetical protein